MKKLAVWISIIGLVLVTGIGFVYWYSAGRDFYFHEINELIQEKAGYKITKSDPLQFSLLPRPTLTARNLIVVNPTAASNPRLAEIGRLSFGLQWHSLLRGRISLALELEAADIDLQIDADGKPNWMTEELQTLSGGLPFELDKVDAVETKFKFINHQTEEILGLDLDHVDIDLTARKSSARIDSAGRVGGSRFLAVGDIEYNSSEQQLDLSLAVGAGEAQDFNVSAIEAPSVTAWIKQNAAHFPLHGLIEGSVSIQDQIPYGELLFKANAQTVDEFEYLIEELSYVQGGIGPVAAKGVMQLNGSDFDIEYLEAALQHDQLSIEVSGKIQNLLSEVQFDLKTKAEAESLRAVVAPVLVKGIAENLFNRLGPIDISASVKKEGNDIVVSELDLGFAHNSFAARIGGELHVTEDDLYFNLDHRSDASDATDLFSLLGLDHPKLSDLGSLKLSAKVSGRRGSYKLERVSGHLQEGNVKTTLGGELSLVNQTLHFDLDSTLDIKDISRLVSLLPEGVEPYLAGLTGEATTEITGTLDEFSIGSLEVTLTRDDRELHVSGSLLDLPDDPKSHLDFRFSTDKPIELEQYFPRLVGIQVVGPLDLAGTVRSADNTIRIQDVRFQAERTDVEGGGLIDLNSTPPNVFIVMGSQEFYTELVVQDPEATGANESAPVSPSPGAESETKLSDQELGEMFRAYTEAVEIQTDWIKDLNLYFSFQADKAQLGAYNLDDLYLTIDAREGVFTLAEYEVVLQGKPISFQGSINTNFNPPTYEFAGKLEGDTLQALLNVEGNLFVGGELSGDFKLNSEGSNLGEVIQNLQGRALVTMGPLVIKSNALNVVSSDMLLSMLKGITRQKKDEPGSAYECGVLGVEVERGIARVKKTFTMQARDYNLAGVGKIDLNTGFVDVTVYPKARKGLGLSVSTLIGGFKMKGHAAAPNFGVGGGGLITAMVTGYALTPTAVYASAANPATATILVTGFFAKGIFDRLTASNFTCKNTLKRIERRQSYKHKSRNHHSGKMEI